MQSISRYATVWMVAIMLLAVSGADVASAGDMDLFIEAETAAATVRQLDVPIAVHFDNATLADAIDRLAEQVGVAIHVDWKALDKVRVTSQSLVSLQVENVPARKVLELLLHQAQIDDEDPLIYRAVEGKVIVATRSRGWPLETRTYPVEDLLAVRDVLPAGAYRNRLPLIRGDNVENQDWVVPTQDMMEVETTRRIQAAYMVQLFSDVIRPRPMVDISGSSLVIKAAPGAHETISELLSQLREAQSLKVSLESRLYVLDGAAIEKLPIVLKAKDGKGSMSEAYCDQTHLRELVLAVNEMEHVSTAYMPRLILQNGHRNFVIVESPESVSPQRAVMLLATAIVSIDHNYSNVELQSVVWDDLSERPAIDQLSRVTIPNNHAVVIDLGEVGPDLQLPMSRVTRQNVDKPGRRALLVLRATVVAPAGDEADADESK